MNYIKEFWTSDLIIQSDIDYDPSSEIARIEKGLKSSKNNTRHLVKDERILRDLLNSIPEDKLNKFVNYEGSGTPDYTGVLKGYALLCMHSDLKYLGSESHTLSFGGDILVHRKNTRVKVSDKFYINISDGCVFTSNNIMRPNHIKVNFYDYDNPYSSVTVIGDNPVVCDYLATQAYSNDMMVGDNIFYMLRDYPTFRGLKVYCASPFFCEEDIRIRDEMIKPYNQAYIFRPDCTDASRSYDKSPGEELAKTIFSENISGISSCDVLLFPKRTTDLGTLFEVGHALYLNKKIISYDHLTGVYELIDNYQAIKRLTKTIQGEWNKLLIHLSSPGNAILLGYLSEGSNGKIYYKIPKGQHDNIMLANSFKRLNDNYEEVDHDFSEID